VIEKLKTIDISTVELGTGTTPATPTANCRCSTTRRRSGSSTELSDNGINSQRAELPRRAAASNPAIRKANQEVQRKTILLAEKLGVPW